jgi:hypothetical protein
MPAGKLLRTPCLPSAGITAIAGSVKQGSLSQLISSLLSD